MSSADLQAILDRVGKLTQEEQAELRAALDASNEETALREMDRRLLEAGLISELPPTPASPRANPVPFIVSGQPASETLIEERR